MHSDYSNPPERTNGNGADRWYTVEQVTQHWPVTRRMLYASIARGECRAAKIGIGKRRIIVRGAWITEWLERASTPQEIRR